MKRTTKTVIGVIGIIVALVALGAFIYIVERDGQPSIIPAEREQVPTTISNSESWHQVVIFSGYGSQATQPFTIKGDIWRISWSKKTNTSKSFLSGLDVYVYPAVQYPASNKEPVYSWSCNQTSYGGTEYSSIEYIPVGKADYYIKIQSRDNTNWKFEIEDYY